MEQPAPVALFVYRRPEHLRRCLQSLLANAEAAASELWVFSDGARDPGAEDAVREVRSILREIGGFARVNLVERGSNYGLSRNITDGIAEVLAVHDSLVVLEEDLELSPFFLRFVNEGLRTYRGDARVASIHGYSYPVKESLPETFFLRGSDCWGWATWRDRWRWFEADGAKLLSALERQGLGHAFDLGGAYHYLRMLQDQIAGRNDSWAVRWHASCFLRGAMTLYPGRSLVHNMGLDGVDATHTKRTEAFEIQPSTEPIRVERIEVAESPRAREAFRSFFLASRPAARKSSWTKQRRKLQAERKRQQRIADAGYSGPFSTWAEAAQKASGYDAEVIFRKVRDALRQVRDAKAVYERDSVLLDRVQYSWPLAASLLRVAARDGRLSVLDFGGSLGTTWYQNRALLRGIAQVEWSIVEQPHFVRCGRQEFSDSVLQFYESAAEVQRARRPNLVLLSSSLQYMPDPRATLQELQRVPAATLVIDRMPLSATAPSAIYVQHVPPEIYPASYPLWVLHRDELLGWFPGYELTAEFDSFCDPQQPFLHRGFLYERIGN